MWASRAAPSASALSNGAQHVALLSAAVGGERGHRGRSDGVGVVLPFSPGRGLPEVRLQGLTDARPLGVAKHVEDVQVSRHQRSQGAVHHHGLKRCLASDARLHRRPAG